MVVMEMRTRSLTRLWANESIVDWRGPVARLVLFVEVGCGRNEAKMSCDGWLCGEFVCLAVVLD